MLDVTGETGLVDIASDAARIHMRRTLNRLEQQGQVTAQAA